MFVAFLIQWYVLITIGPGMETDALFAGMALPQMVLAIISSSLMHILVPLFAGEGEKQFAEDAWGFFILIGLFFSSLIFILYLFAFAWVPLLFPGFSVEGKILTIHLTRIQLLGMIFTALSGVLWAIYHARQQFIWAESTPLIGTTIGLGVLFWTLPKYGIVAAAWVSVIRSIVQTLLLLPGLGSYCKPNFSSVTFKEAWRRIKPLLIGTSYYKTDILVDRFLSSMTEAGGLSLLNIGQQIYSAFNFILNKSIAAPLVPALAVSAKNKQWKSFRNIYRKKLILVICITAIVYLLFLLIGRTFLKLIIGHGGVTEQNIEILWLLIICLVGTLIGGAMGQILSSAFYAKGNTITPTRIGIIGFTVGIVLKITSFLIYGLVGIAIGTTIYYLLNAFVLLIFLERELHNHLYKRYEIY